MKAEIIEKTIEDFGYPVNHKEKYISVPYYADLTIAQRNFIRSLGYFIQYSL